MFRSRGRVFRECSELFNETSWFAVFDRPERQPRGYDPLVDTLTEDEFRKRMANIRDTIAKCAATMPTHREFIAKNCEAAKG